MQEWVTNKYIPHMASKMRTSQVSKQLTPREGSSNGKEILATRETYMEENAHVQQLMCTAVRI